MPRHDPARIADTRDWLAKVDLDLRASSVDLNTEPPLIEDALFHAQQAAEKSMKAFLTWQDEPFGRTHDLRALGEQCIKLDPTLEPVLRNAVQLSQYAWKFRYPGNAPSPQIEEAKEALVIAQQVSNEIRVRLPGEADP